MTKEERKEYMKAWYEAHKEKVKARVKAYYESHKEKVKATKKSYRQAHKEQTNEYAKAYMKSYMKSDVNTNGESKNSIRTKSRHYLKKYGTKIPGYEIHHCFGYEDPSKFIYISKALHLKIHKYLRDNNIDASTDHWMHIRDLVNDTDEFTYIKC